MHFRVAMTQPYRSGEDMKLLAMTFALIGTLAFTGILIGCEEPGPAERMGEGIDDAAEEMRDAVEDATDR
jgi:hypothetical protein